MLHRCHGRPLLLRHASPCRCAMCGRAQTTTQTSSRSSGMALSSHTLSWWLSNTGDRHCRDSWTVTPPAQTEGQSRRPAPAPWRASRATALAPDWSTPAPPATRASPSTLVSAAVAEHTCGRPRPSIQAGAITQASAITTKHKYGKKKGPSHLGARRRRR